METVVEIVKTKRSDVSYIDPKIIMIVADFNTRMDYGDLNELKNSIVENGVRIPLLVTKRVTSIFLLTGIVG